METLQVFIEYFLDEKYKTFEFMISNCYNSRSTKGKTKYVIYGDNEVIYKSGAIGSETLPEQIVVDVSNIRQLKIELEPTSGGNQWDVAIIEPKLGA